MSKTYIADKETLDSVNEKVSAILAIEKDENVYGFIEHMDVLSPSNRIEYIGLNKNFSPIKITMGGGYSLGDWADFPVLTECKPYMVKSDGNADYELDSNNYAKKASDGSASDVANASYDGGAFSWIRKVYKKEYIVGSDRVVKFSLEPRDGYTAVGFIDTDNNELEGVWLPMFYGHIDSNSKMLCISGTQPCYSNQTSAEKTAIDAFGARAKFFGGPIMETLQDLLIMWGKTTDTQAKYGKGNMSGYDSTLTPTMGVLANAVVGGGMFYGTSDAKSLNKILHSIVLGSWQQWQRDPYTIMVNGRIKVSKNYAYSLTAEGYSDTGITLPKITKDDGSQNTGAFYPHRYQSVQGFGALPVYPYKGSTSTGGCDGLWQNVEITAVALRLGACNSGAIAGVRALILDHAATLAYWHLGASVLLLPPAGASPADAA